MKIYTIMVGGTIVHIELGHTKNEWIGIYGEDTELWDINFEDFITGAVEPDGDVVYWYIDGRFYETIQTL